MYPEQNISESNKLIAEFMGIEFSNNGQNCNHPFIKAPWPPIEALQYHKSWDWLMPVVEKIESISVMGTQWTVLDDNSNVEWNFMVKIEGKQCMISRCAYDGCEEDFLKLYDCRNYKSEKKQIDFVYNALVEFIKWYNHKTLNHE